MEIIDKDKKFNKQYVIDTINAKFKKLQANNTLNPRTKFLDSTQETEILDGAFRFDYNLNANIIIETLDDIVRHQIMVDINEKDLFESSWGFWKQIPKSGTVASITNIISPTSRDINIRTDLAQVTEDFPVVENEKVVFDNYYGIDKYANGTLESRTTLVGFTNYLSSFYQYIRKSIDKFLHDSFKNIVINYPNYKEIVIDTTDLTEEQIAIEQRKVIMRHLLLWSEEVQNVDNEAYEGTNFYYNINKSDVALITDIDSEINDKLFYLRTQRFQSGESKSAIKDFGLGHIVTKDIGTNTQILIPKQKFMYGIEYDHGITYFGYSGKTLETRLFWYGFTFMKSAPSIKITSMVVPPPTKKLTSEEQIAINTVGSIKKYIADVENKKAQLNKDVACHKFTDGTVFELIKKEKEKYDKLIKDAQKMVKSRIDNITIIRPKGNPKKVEPTTK